MDKQILRNRKCEVTFTLLFLHFPINFRMILCSSFNLGQFKSGNVRAGVKCRQSNRRLHGQCDIVDKDQIKQVGTIQSLLNFRIRRSPVRETAGRPLH